MAEIKLLDDPFPCSSGYTIDAYCKYDNPEHEYHSDRPRGSETFSGRNERDARAEAHRRGWRIGRDWIAVCPLCRRALRGSKP